MLISFTLTMPNRNTWNGRWSGEDRLYVRIKNLGHSKKAIEHAKELLAKKDFYYHWEDGWTAKVTLKKIEASEANRLRRKTNGFCGYEWMIESILDSGEIKTKASSTTLQ